MPRMSPMAASLLFEEGNDSPSDLFGALQVQEVPGAGQDNLLHAFGKEIVHALERLQAPGTILRPVDGERADGRRRGIHALLQRVQGGIAIAGMKRVPIVAERGGYYAGLAKGALDALHF